MMKIILAISLALVGHVFASALTTGSRCSAHKPCPEPLSCVGNPNNLRCFQKREAGMRCGQDPFWVCADGLACIHAVCKTVAGNGDSCLDSNTVCDEGLHCVGPAHNLKCFRPKQVGQQCEVDPFWICDEGLACANNVCNNVVGNGGSCGDPYTVCDEGLHCVGPAHNLKCVKPKQFGGRCGNDPFWVCDVGLRCVEGTCRRH